MGEKTNGLTENQERGRDELQRIVTALKIKQGELNIEILLDENDKPHFLELGPRAGDNMISIQISDAFGVDLIKVNVLVAMGERSQLEPLEKEGYFCHYVVHSDRDGIFQDVSSYSDAILPCISQMYIQTSW